MGKIKRNAKIAYSINGPSGKDNKLSLVQCIVEENENSIYNDDDNDDEDTISEIEEDNNETAQSKGKKRTYDEMINDYDSEESDDTILRDMRIHGQRPINKERDKELKRWLQNCKKECIKRSKQKRQS